MKTINISTDAATHKVPVVVPFEAAPGDDFFDGEEVLVQLVNHNGEKVGESEVRSIIKTVDADESHRAWYDAYVPAKRI